MGSFSCSAPVNHSHMNALCRPTSKKHPGTIARKKRVTFALPFGPTRVMNQVPPRGAKKETTEHDEIRNQRQRRRCCETERDSRAGEHVVEEGCHPKEGCAQGAENRPGR